MWLGLQTYIYRSFSVCDSALKEKVKKKNNFSPFQTLLIHNQNEIIKNGSNCMYIRETIDMQWWCYTHTYTRITFHFELFSCFQKLELPYTKNRATKKNIIRKPIAMQ